MAPAEPEVEGPKYRYVKYESTGTPINSNEKPFGHSQSGITLQFFQVDVNVGGTLTPITDATITSYNEFSDGRGPATKVLTESETNKTGDVWNIWFGQQGENGFFVMDLGSDYSISQYRIKNSRNTHGDYFSKDFKVSLSTDGTNFTEDITGTLTYDITNIQTFTSTSASSSIDEQTRYNENLVSNISGMAGWYSADQYNASTRVWTDKSPNNNDITGVSASLSVVSNGLNGEPVVAGGTGVSVMFPVGYHYLAPSGTTNYSSYARSEFTMFTVARATTTTFKRVFTGSDDPGLSINGSNC